MNSKVWHLFTSLIIITLIITLIRLFFYVDLGVQLANKWYLNILYPTINPFEFWLKTKFLKSHTIDEFYEENKDTIKLEKKNRWTFFDLYLISSNMNLSEFPILRFGYLRPYAFRIDSVYFIFNMDGKPHRVENVKQLHDDKFVNIRDTIHLTLEMDIIEQIEKRGHFESVMKILNPKDFMKAIHLTNNNSDVLLRNALITMGVLNEYPDATFQSQWAIDYHDDLERPRLYSFY